MSGPGFFSYGGVTSAEVFRMLSALQELSQKLLKIAAVKGGEEYNKGLTSLDDCRKKIQDITSSPKADFHLSREIEMVNLVEHDEQRTNKFSI